MTEDNKNDFKDDCCKNLVYVSEDIVNTGIGVVIDVQNVYKYF